MTEAIGQPPREMIPRSDEQEKSLQDIMRDILYELRNTGSPPPITQIVNGYTVKNDLRLQKLIITNTGAAGVNTLFRFGGAAGVPFAFSVPANDTRVIPLPRVLPRGTDISITGDVLVYMVADLYHETNR